MPRVLFEVDRPVIEASQDCLKSPFHPTTTKKFNSSTDQRKIQRGSRKSFFEVFSIETKQIWQLKHLSPMRRLQEQEISRSPALFLQRLHNVSRMRDS
jgi:hypothetical protein